MPKNALQVFETDIQGCVKVLFQRHMDPRGTFEESWHMEKFLARGLPTRWPQDNVSISFKHTLRGLHYQTKNPQGKLVRCFGGTIWDVCVDIRPTSPTFGKWTGCFLTWEHPLGFFVPPGCAHGYVVLSESAMVHYKCTRLYNQEADTGIRWNDASLAIEWPLEKGTELIVSPRDQKLPLFSDVFPDQPRSG